MTSYSINSISNVDGSVQEITKNSSVDDILDKSSQEDFLRNVVSMLQSQKFNDIKVPVGDRNNRPYLFYDPSVYPTQPTVNDWKMFIQGTVIIDELDQIRFNEIINETFLLGKRFMLALKNYKGGKNINYKSKHGYSYNIMIS
jgi:hypothetical protein